MTTFIFLISTMSNSPARSPARLTQKYLLRFLEIGKSTGGDVRNWCGPIISALRGYFLARWMLSNMRVFQGKRLKKAAGSVASAAHDKLSTIFFSLLVYLCWVRFRVDIADLDYPPTYLDRFGKLQV